MEIVGFLGYKIKFLLYFLGFTLGKKKKKNCEGILYSNNEQGDGWIFLGQGWPGSPLLPLMLGRCDIWICSLVVLFFLRKEIFLGFYLLHNEFGKIRKTALVLQLSIDSPSEKIDFFFKIPMIWFPCTSPYKTKKCRFSYQKHFVGFSPWNQWKYFPLFCIS